MDASRTAAQTSLRGAAADCLACTDPGRKLALTFASAQALAEGRLRIDPEAAAVAVEAPGRPSRPRRVPPRQLSARGLGSRAGRAAFVHAIAHIEFNAINLAWDAVARFSGMPEGFYRDWAGIAVDEARHFRLLEARLSDLGHHYGDFDAHDGLWEMAAKTAHSCLARMALVPRVLEARGLDVTPGMIGRLRAVGDHDTAQVLELILREEVAHVAAGTRWFRWCCAREGAEPHATFVALVDRYAPGALRGPFNRSAREAAGFDAEDMAWLEQEGACA